jgi:nitrilase
MKRLKAAAVQISPDLSGCDTVDRVCSAVARAAAQGVELAVFPETFIPYYPYFSFVIPPVLSGKEHLRLYEHAVEIPGPITARLGLGSQGGANGSHRRCQRARRRDSV